MTMLTNEAKQRACDLANGNNPYHCVRPIDVNDSYPSLFALAQLCQRMDELASRDDVGFGKSMGCQSAALMSHFRLPKPTPDPLVEAVHEACCDTNIADHRVAELTSAIREHLAKTGHTIAKAGA